MSTSDTLNSVQPTVTAALEELAKVNPKDPLMFLSQYFASKSKIAPTISKLVGRQILDSRGNPTVQVDVYAQVGGIEKFIARGNAPSGASTGSHEALEMRDGDANNYLKKSVTKAVGKVTNEISKVVAGLDGTDLWTLDNAVIKADGTNLKTVLGGNSMTATSFALARAGAALTNKQIFLYLVNTWKKVSGKNPTKFSLPVPMVNVLNGGKHGGNALAIQEFMILPSREKSFKERLRTVTTVYHHLGKILSKKYGQTATNLGDEGGFAPPLDTADQALEALEEATVAAGFKVGIDITFALDAAASEFYNAETKKYEITPKNWVTASELIEYYKGLIDRHPAIASIEDALDENDYPGWIEFTALCDKKNIMSVGDDLYTTNVDYISRGIKSRWANALLLKVNQIGTITEAMTAADMVMKQPGEVIVSHRSGETTCSLIADLVVAIGAGYIKTGATARGERVCKYNRLLQIEEYLAENNMLASGTATTSS